MMEESKQRGMVLMASPSFRIWLCGTFRIERWVGTAYEVVRTVEWGGSSYPRLLLKALLCYPGRQARREALQERLWPDLDPEHAAQHLNTATTKLRNVLRPTKEQESLLLTENDATVYRLEGHQRLWVDVDEALALLQEAERLGRTSLEAFHLLERVGDYFQRGPLLQEDEGFWVAGRRATVDQARYRALLWLADAYIWQEMPGQAATIFHQLLEEDPLDEDIVYRLMELLHRQGMSHQAMRLYKRTCELLAHDGLEPAETVRTFAARIQESRHCPPLLSVDSVRLVPSLLLPPSLEAERARHVRCDILTSNTEVVSGDCTTWCSERLVQIIAFVTQRQTMRTTDFESLLDRGLRAFDEVKTVFDSETYLLSRRNALLVIAALPKGLLTLLQQQQKAAFIEEAFLPACTASITACWHLLNESEFALVERAVTRYLPFLIEWARPASTYQKTAAYLASQAYLLLGLVELHRLQFQQRIVYCREAVEYAKGAENRLLLIKALAVLGNALYDHKQYADMLQAYQQAKYLLDGTQIPIPCVLQSKVLTGLAHAYAQQGNVADALKTMSEAHTIFPGETTEDVPVFLSADDGIFSLILFDGMVRLDLGRQEPKQEHHVGADKALARIEELPQTVFVPERIRAEIINRRAQAAIALGQLDEFRDFTLQSVKTLQVMQSEKRRYELVINYKTALKKWPHEPKVVELADVVL